MTCSKCQGCLYRDIDDQVEAILCLNCGARTYAPFQPHVMSTARLAQATFCKNCGEEPAMSDARAVAKIHELKTWPEYFQPLLDGVKHFEVRQNDRGFQVGDTLRLQEYDPRYQRGYSGRELLRTVTYMTDVGQLGNFVVLGLDITAALEAACPKVTGSLRTQLILAMKTFSDYLPEPLEPGDGDELIHLIEPIVSAALEARERAVWEEAEKYIETVINQRVDPVLLDAAKTKREVSATREEREEYDMLLEIRDECRRHGGPL